MMVGSFGEEDIFESSLISSTVPTNSITVDHRLILQEILESETDGERDILEKCLENLSSGEEASITNMNMRKKLIVEKLRENYEASLCQSSWATTFDRSKIGKKLLGEYEYIDVMMKKDNNSGFIRLIVDIDFRSQFEIGRATASYKSLLQEVPTVFVGSEEKLSKTIFLLCSAANLSLKQSGLHIPPWRRPSYVHSKWLSSSSPKNGAPQNTPEMRINCC